MDAPDRIAGPHPVDTRPTWVISGGIAFPGASLLFLGGPVELGDFRDSLYESHPVGQMANQAPDRKSFRPRGLQAADDAARNAGTPSGWGHR